MKKLILFFLFFPLLAQAAFLNTTYDANRITINIGTNTDGHAVLFMKGRYNVTGTAAANFCILIDPLKLSTMQGAGDTTLYNLLWNTPSCADTDNAPPCIPSGAVVYLQDHPWCLQ